MTGKVALISGASRGIGAAVAADLKAQGWDLSLGMRRPEDVPAELAGTHVVQHDAAAATEGDWVRAALDRFGRIDAVICCAGIMTPRDVIEIDDAALDTMFEVNVKSPRRLVGAAWEALTETGAGRVIILASLSGRRVASAMSGSYAMSKFAAVALCHGIRQKGWDAGIRATAVCPGYVDTDMGRAVTDFPPEDMTRPEDVAQMVRLALEMPNGAAMAEMSVNCRLEPSC